MPRGKRIHLSNPKGKLVWNDSPWLAAGIVQSESAQGGTVFFHARSASVNGQAVTYEKRRPPKSVEVHTCLTAHPFELDLSPGIYALTALRGKEYLPAIKSIIVSEETVKVELIIKRWIRMTDHGWFSGDTHNHREMENMHTLLLAEDLNVGLPLTAWVSKFEETPKNSSKVKNPIKNGELINVDENHVIWTGNTEYEIGSIGDKRHTLGALFVLNHTSPLDLKALPVRSIAEQASSDGAILELDKHNWPWSMMLVPVAKVDLFELTNNHIW